MSSKLFTLLLSGILTASSFTYLHAEEDMAVKGRAIFEEADARDKGWGDMTSDMTMTLRNSRGEESIRSLRIQSLEMETDGDKSLTIFDEPADVRGTALLTYSHKTEDDEQWLYLPALKRVKRINSANKSGPFMGSEFAYEDLSSQEVSKYTYNYIGEDDIEGTKTWVIERFPVDKNSGYTKQVVWMGQDRYVPVKIDYYDRKDSLMKTLTATNYQQYMDKYWRASNLSMVNHQTGKSTDLVWSNIQFNTGLEERDFNKRNLQRIR